MANYVGEYILLITVAGFVGLLILKPAFFTDAITLFTKAVSSTFRFASSS